MVRKVVISTMLVAAALALVPEGASAQAPAAFGPVESRTFHFKPGTALERASANCSNNADWLIVRGPGVANTKRVEVSPRVSVWDKQTFPSSDCVGPNCFQMLVKVTERDAVGPHTVTLKNADGRTVTTTFDVVENAGRCDYPKGK